MTFCYFLQFIDKVTLNYGNVMGLQAELGLVGDQFSRLPMSFFIAYIVFEFLQMFVIQKFPVAKVLGVNVVIWGILTACCAATQNFAGILVVRILLGASEAAIVPCMMILTSNFVDKKDAAFFTGVWYSGLGIGQIVGGLLSFLFQHVSLTAPVSGWRIMFIVIGMLNILAGVYVFLVLPSTPLENKKLTAKEKYVLLVKLTEGKLGVTGKIFKPKQALELLFDIQGWLFLLICATISFSSNTISTFSSIDIVSFGFTSKEAALLGMPSGVVSVFASVVASYFIKRGSPRYLTICCTLVPAVVGAALMSYLPSNNKAGLLIGIYLVNFITCPYALAIVWASSNVSGSTKKIGMQAVFISVGFALGNITGPLSYRAVDAPKYEPAKVSMLITQCVSIGLALVIVGIYYIRNKKRDKYVGEYKDETENAWADLTDFENKRFRYLY
ncbi:hypothetical protein CANTEDRAFT_120846 [Yamadazyma tenuis ATCC 10573]|uniref:Major facilitator superfamily (MFS) profile domain-containing protein n=2 Tax=Candida tenuis TaxID=2315449 RepID=G3B0W8_CANTC|nr:uncharacterized protein CANTEDRAFT_120846 [Yamadazyma tenuis ATCC 10573]EGV64827.1 hypothetical protein CANTEDRAFT_120846 [Yamadazyma tenuis ATCC 10573]